MVVVVVGSGGVARYVERVLDFLPRLGYRENPLAGKMEEKQREKETEREREKKGKVSVPSSQSTATRDRENLSSSCPLVLHASFLCGFTGSLLQKVLLLCLPLSLSSFTILFSHR